MYHVSVRDHFMIAHSFTGEVFGPARRLHGATYVVDVTFRRSKLDEHELVVDIGRASDVLREVLAPLDYRNLDEEADFRGKNTTTEFLARHIWEGVARRLRSGDLGASPHGIESVEVVLRESHVARAGYEGRP
ncbi:MAG: 6-carboxytetrahydropterin synthase [Gemmatimonadales bacterium]|nr:MAG: 6-carboxytetrahydropterin synthase [Gemmatimonadales bacterium]